MFPLLRHCFFILSILLFFGTLPAFAQQVKSVKPSGILEFQDGQQVHLAGLIIPDESLASLSVLVAGKEMNFEEAKNYPQDLAIQAGYLYVKAFEMDFPFKPASQPRESTIMVNQLMLSLGLARVDNTKEFKHREQFLKIEAEARDKGMGIWSYE